MMISPPVLFFSSKFLDSQIGVGFKCLYVPMKTMIEILELFMTVYLEKRIYPRYPRSQGKRHL